PDEPRGRQADQRRGPRVRERDRGQLHTGVYLLELLPVQDGTVADEEHLAALNLELGRQRVRRGHPVLPVPHDAARDRTIQAVEHLPSAGVDYWSESAAGGGGARSVRTARVAA